MILGTAKREHRNDLAIGSKRENNPEVSNASCVVRDSLRPINIIGTFYSRLSKDLATRFMVSGHTVGKRGLNYLGTMVTFNRLPVLPSSHMLRSLSKEVFCF